MRSSLWDIRLWILLFAAILYVNVALADKNSGDTITQSNDMNNQTAGDLAVEGSVFNGGDAFAFAHALGDVDINDCLASTQWGTILVSKQKVVLNAWCAAEVYDAKGMYEMAAMMRCNVPAIIAEFDSEAECERLNTFRPPTPVVTDDAPDIHNELYMQEQMHDEQLDEVLVRLEQLEKPRPAPRPQTVYQQQEFIDADKREQLRKLRDEDEE